MKKSSTESYVLTMPLRYEAWQRDRLDKMFRIAGNMYNDLVADRKKALEQLERTKEWKAIQSSLRVAYEAGEDSKSALEFRRNFPNPPWHRGLQAKLVNTTVKPTLPCIAALWHG